MHNLMFARLASTTRSPSVSTAEDHAEHEGAGGGGDHPTGVRRRVRLRGSSQLSPHPRDEENSRIVPGGTDLRHHRLRGGGGARHRRRFPILFQGAFCFCFLFLFLRLKKLSL